MKRFLGLDAGSISVKLALIDENGQILHTVYERHKGKPLEVALRLLEEGDYGSDVSINITGSAGRLIASGLEVEPMNEVVAQSYAIKKLYPQIRSIIEMGGEDSKLIIMEDGKVKEFSMNSVCAAGTGSFLDQQAERLFLSIEEFGQMALLSKNPPRIAGRCSVFAKSDMIHLQQIATPLEDIVAGLCFAVARNFKGTICKNMTLPEPISFQGGVAANKGVLRAFKEVFESENIMIPEHHAVMGAIGAALKSVDENQWQPLELGKLHALAAQGSFTDKGLSPLINDIDDFNNRHKESPQIVVPTNGKKIDAYLGIDIGSISTNLALIDEHGRLLSKRYLMTAGRPIEAVRRGLAEVGDEIGDSVRVLGVATTGSGRYMIADFVGADIVKNEITAQATAAASIDPEVDTIFEIGGQDSKYISLRDGIIVDFEMNKACAAGTGSFLEEQAEKLAISIKKEYEELACSSKSPCALGERCTVFMENSLVSKQQSGARKEDLVAGLAYSIVQNYINRVVSGRKIGQKIFFQGGVAFNKSVVAAFEQYLGRQIVVPPHHDVTGAIGMAMIARQHFHETGISTSFKGFDLSRRAYSISSFECKGCSNRCEVNKVKVDGEEDALFYGSRCEKYDVKRKKTEFNLPDLFVEREALLLAAHKSYEGNRHHSFKANIGLPRLFFFQDSLPYWSTFLWELGFKVTLSSATNRKTVERGTEIVLSESCFPVKVAHGHIAELLEQEPEAIFLPSFISINEKKDSFHQAAACPYVQTMPYLANVAFPAHQKTRFIATPINYRKGENDVIDQLWLSLRRYGISKRYIKKAMAKAKSAQDAFETAVRTRGDEILANLTERALVITGRSYNASDPGLNLEIPKKLRALGVLPIPMDFLPLDNKYIESIWPHMYWHSGQRILAAVEIIRDNPKLYPLYISNFSCGPDSFIHRYFKEAMGGKPFLQLEIDEHSADAGAITRCEAFLDSINNVNGRDFEEPTRVQNITIGNGRRPRRVFIPKMCDHAYAVAAAFEACGMEAEVMPVPDRQSVAIGRSHVSGKECLPCAVTTGDMLKITQRADFDPSNDSFFMPSGSGPCRFGQYNVLQRLVLDKVNLRGVPIFAPNQDTEFYSELGVVSKDFSKLAWRGIVAIDLLLKCLHETRPYEINKGRTDAVYNKYLKEIPKVVKLSDDAVYETLKAAKQEFSSIPKRNEKRPLIGIIGEIYVRLNTFSNEDIVQKVEALGGEVWLAPMEEWMYYLNAMGFRHAAEKWDIKDMVNVAATGFFQKRIEHKLARPFEGFLKTLHEPTTEEIMKKAAPYVHKSFEGETILSLGKAVDFVEKKASGIISTSPFGCMPGVIVDSLLRGLKRNTGVPCLTIAYDGNEDTGTVIQLEAFMYQ
ncbi:MAG TPA: acyl-CoA dehydratase activase, partial [Thermodesulfovibrionia bacterium]|nr:acyl-CoA dehydratase activase [Thermodesulfovibrionia bacterium]